MHLFVVVTQMYSKSFGCLLEDPNFGLLIKNLAKFWVFLQIFNCIRTEDGRIDLFVLYLAFFNTSMVNIPIFTTTEITKKPLVRNG